MSPTEPDAGPAPAATEVPAPKTAARPHGEGSAPAGRIAGYDVARALAVLGMVVVHFSLVMSFRQLETHWAGWLVELLDGRAAATFVILAGVGVTLRSRGAVRGGDPKALSAVRAGLLRRGLFLLAMGFVNLAIWPGDILRVYGVSLLLVPWLLQVSGRALWAISLAFVLGFALLLVPLDYGRNWDWHTLTYRNLWTPAGLVRNLFYDGFRSVFPWTGLLVLGMWLGRLDVEGRRTTRVLLVAGIAAWLLTELVSHALLGALVGQEQGPEAEEARALFGTQSMPPLPLFLLSASGFAVAVIAASLLVARRFPGNVVVRALVATGQLALTWYVAHIVLGLGALVALGLVEDQPLTAALACAAGFYTAAALLSLWWKSRFRYGPLEGLLRWATAS
jgi:uncharacterized membrane protein YeiB